MRFVLLLVIFPFFSCNQTEPHNAALRHHESPQPDVSYSETVIKRQLFFADEARTWCAAHHYNNSFFLLADMSLPSGKNRLFMYDLNKGTVVCAGLVAHGCCNTRFLSQARFSNAVGCGCSSFGKYKVCGRYEGSYGTAYRLIGLDSSNSNAARRNIVLHSYYSVPDEDVFPASIGNSYGCVMVSIAFFKTLQPYIDGTSKPILLWVAE